MAPSDTPKKMNGLAIVEEGDFFIVREPRRVHVFNASGVTIFGLCDGTKTVSNIAGIIGEMFGLDQEPLEDVDECVSEMQRRGLISFLSGSTESPP